MELVIAVVAMVLVLAFWQKSNYLRIIAGPVAISFGAYWIDEGGEWIYTITGIAVIAIGLYLLIDAAITMFRKE